MTTGEPQGFEKKNSHSAWTRFNDDTKNRNAENTRSKRHPFQLGAVHSSVSVTSAFVGLVMGVHLASMTVLQMERCCHILNAADNVSRRLMDNMTDNRNPQRPTFMEFSLVNDHGCCDISERR